MFFFTNSRYFTDSVKNDFSSLFFCKQKAAKVFQWEKDVDVAVIICNHCFVIYKTVSLFFELLIFSHDVWGNFGKSISSPKQNKLKEIWDICRRRRAENDNSKINASRIYLVPFCFSKLVHFSKISFRENQRFESVSSSL